MINPQNNYCLKKKLEEEEEEDENVGYIEKQ